MWVWKSLLRRKSIQLASQTYSRPKARKITSKCLSFPISSLEMHCEKVLCQGDSLFAVLNACGVQLHDVELSLGIRPRNIPQLEATTGQISHNSMLLKLTLGYRDISSWFQTLQSYLQIFKVCSIPTEEHTQVTWVATCSLDSARGEKESFNDHFWSWNLQNCPSMVTAKSTKHSQLLVLSFSHNHIL